MIIRSVHRSMKDDSKLALEAYIKRDCLVLEDFFFFSLYSFSCIGINSTAMENILTPCLCPCLSILTSSSVCDIPITCARPHPLQRLCVNIQALNRATINNRHHLPVTSELLDRVHEARIFTKVDLRTAFHLIEFKEANEYKTAVRTRYRYFEYRVMPFGLTNAPVSFQAYIDNCLWPYIDDFTVYYLNDILINSANEKEYEDDVRNVLPSLQEFERYCTTENSPFGVREVGFLGFVINSDGIIMESDRITTIEDSPTPESVWDVHVHLCFTNFNLRFIQKYAKVMAPISNLLKTQG